MSKPAVSDEYRLARQIEAAKVLRDSLKDYAEDDDIIRDMIEGETDLHDMIERVVLSMDEDEILLTGIKARIEELGERKARIKARYDGKRAMVEQAMVVGELNTLERATFTVSTRKTPATLIVSDESAIPARFWKPADPVLDKAELKKALDNKEPVEGVSLSNGGIGIQIRKK